MYNIFRIH